MPSPRGAAWWSAPGCPRSTAHVLLPALGAGDAKKNRFAGSYMGSCVPKRDIPRFIALYQRGKLPVQKLRSGFIGFDEINEGFDRLADGAVLRQVLRP